MDSNFLSLLEESKALNSSVFSLIRLQLLSSIAGFGEDGITYRELKATLQVTDGALYTNLKALEGNGYIKSQKIILEGKNLDSYKVTSEGQQAWEQIKNWLKKFVECGVKE
ncbi:MAG: transcriptional regulator [Candidatus Diapherotrites archaeon]